MPKERPSKRKKTQHEKFVALAHESGADESEASFVAKVRVISLTKPKEKKARKEPRGGKHGEGSG
jgi:hypothetical protein